MNWSEFTSLVLEFGLLAIVLAGMGWLLWWGNNRLPPDAIRETDRWRYKHYLSRRDALARLIRRGIKEEEADEAQAIARREQDEEATANWRREQRESEKRDRDGPWNTSSTEEAGPVEKSYQREAIRRIGELTHHYLTQMTPEELEQVWSAKPETVNWPVPLCKMSAEDQRSYWLRHVEFTTWPVPPVLLKKYAGRSL